MAPNRIHPTATTANGAPPDITLGDIRQITDHIDKLAELCHEMAMDIREMNFAMFTIMA